MDSSIEKIKCTITYIIKSQQHRQLTNTSGVVVIADEILHYRISNVVNKKYYVEIITNDKLRYHKTKTNHKCKYCNTKNCNMIIKCCNKYCHIECFKKQNYNCNCKQRTKETIVLQKSQKDICCVCLDKCKTVTMCNHCLCRGCANQIHDEYGVKSKCPICRKPLTKRVVNDKIHMNLNLNLDNQDENIEVSIIYYNSK